MTSTAIRIPADHKEVGNSISRVIAQYHNPEDGTFIQSLEADRSFTNVYSLQKYIFLPFLIGDHHIVDHSLNLSLELEIVFLVSHLESDHMNGLLSGIACVVVFD